MTGDGLSFTITRDERDWRSASWLLTRDRWLWRRLVIVAVVLWAAYVALGVLPGIGRFGWDRSWIAASALWGTEWALVVIAAAVVLTCVMVPIRVRRIFANATKLAATTHFAFDARSLRATNDDGVTTLGWDKFARWLENDRVLVLVVVPGRYYVIAISQVAPATIAALRSALMAANVPHPSGAKP